MLLYFDTNLYARISETREQTRLRRWLRDEGHVLLISDANLYEMLQIPKEAARDEQLGLLLETGGAWPGRRLMPAALLEARELFLEIRRLRPWWTRRSEPSSARAREYLEHHHDFWRTAATSPRRAAEAFAKSYLPVAKPAMEERAASERAIAQAFRESLGGRAELSFQMTVGGREHLAGWDEAIGRWRMDSADLWVSALLRRPEAMRDYYDYLAPDLALDRISENALRRLFLEEVDPSRLPRNLVRGLMEQRQLERRIQVSNSADSDHATRVIDVDLLATADARMSDCLKEVCARVPTRGEVLKVERETASVLRDLEAALKAGPSR